MSQKPVEGSRRRRKPIGTMIAVLIMGAACVILGVGIGSFYLWQEDSEVVIPVDNQEFQANAETYANNQTLTYNGVIQAGSGAIAPSPTPTPTPSPTPIPSPTPVITETPVPTEVPEDNGSGMEMPSSDFIFPNSDTQLLTDADLSRLGDAASCQRAINEIFARHGYEFHYEGNSVDYEYFNSKAWYQSMTKKDQSEAMAEFSQEEMANVNAISNYRASQGW